MINTIQPFVNLVNANLKATSHFMQSPEMTEITSLSMDKFGKATQESFMRIVESEALGKLMREMLNNCNHFANEYMQTTFSFITQTQNLFSHQVQDFSRQIEKGVGASMQAVVERTSEIAEDEAELRAGKDKPRLHRHAA